MTSIDAFILVGGRSTRFGSDKAAVKIDGDPILDRIANVIAEGLPNSTIKLVAANPEQLLRFGNDFSFVLDLYQDRGPVGALQAALANTVSDWAFVMACDLPLVTSQLIERLAAFTREAAADAVIPIQPDGQPQPLCGFYRVHPCLLVCEEILTQPRPAPGVKAIFDAINVTFVDFGDIEDLAGSGNFFLNMNTPDDLDQASICVRPFSKTGR